MEFIQIIVYLSIYVGLVATSFYILSYIYGIKKQRPLYEENELPFVSVIIPAYNEEMTIERTLDSIKKSEYPKEKFEIIVIDDGSKDNTLKVAKRYESEIVRVFHKENGGKGSALNFGISKAKGEIVFSMDADTIVSPLSMKRMVKYFKDSRIMSVSPGMVTEKPETIWQRVQYIEYLIGLLLRKAFATLDAIFVVPGAFSAYRKSFFEKYGGYEVENITEDLELALRIQASGFLTENCPEAPAYTRSPGTFKSLLLQRRRWYYGWIKNVWRYKSLFGRKTGDLGMFVLPVALLNIIFSLFVTFYLFFKTLGNVRDEFLFLQNVDFDVLNSITFNLYTIERTLFLLLSNPVILFILLFLVMIGIYLIYASKKIGKVHNIYFNLPIFFLLFSVLFGIWWIVSIFYALFTKNIKWK
ncbi:MAG: glycosyltransferase [Nanoarchaeota archaeon]